MKKPKFTKGPWEDRSGRIVSTGKKRVKFGDNNEFSRDPVVCQASTFVDTKFGSSEMKANSALIAAAPEYYAFAEAFAEYENLSAQGKDMRAIECFEKASRLCEIARKKAGVIK